MSSSLRRLSASGPVSRPVPMRDFVICINNDSNPAILKGLEAAYRQMAREEAREREALDWAEATLGDVADEAR